MPSTSLDAVRPATRSTGSRLLSLPFELRFEIYELYINSCYHGEIDDDTVVAPWIGWKATRLLHACKQIYEEASPIFYKKMTISCNLEQWKKFFEMIGPRNIANIQDLSITYSCRPDYNFPCLGYITKDDDYLTDILGLLKNSQAESRLKTLTLSICPCHGFWKDEDERRPEDISFTECNVYKDLGFLKRVSSLSNVQEIRLKSLFDPLWGKSLRKRLGFIALHYDDGSITFINQKHPDFNTDLRGYKSSQSLDGVYEEVTNDPEPKESDEDADDSDDSWDPAPDDDVDPEDQWV